jgi:hypothetical protein
MAGKTFSVQDRVEVISDGRIGTIKETNGGLPGGVEVVENCLVQFGNDIMKSEWFKPDQLRPLKEALERHKANCPRCIQSGPGQWDLCEKGQRLLAAS